MADAVAATQATQAALQVIVLGSGGGPIEDNATSFLVRSTATEWQKGSVLAVDAGVHLASILKILEDYPIPMFSSGVGATTLTDGPFRGLRVPHSSAKANAGYITGTLINAYLITHPHLDHISGFVVNTAALPGPNSRPKRLAGLPHTIEAFKTHIFNNVIWPNLSDENNGAGLVTYMRLVEGGSPAIGDGEGKGYIEISEGLGVKTWGVSHGHCIEHHSHRGSNAGLGPTSQPEASPRLMPRSISQLQQNSPRSDSISGLSDTRSQICVCDSSAYFIRDFATGKEVLIFGDVEPDAISLSPRNRNVWSEAAPMIVSNRLGGIFIECSYDDSQSEDRLYGHMAPRYLIEELKVLAEEVENFRAGRDKDKRKRKRIRQMLGDTGRRRSTRSSAQMSPVSPLSQPPYRANIEVTAESYADHEEEPESPTFAELPVRQRDSFPLRGLKIIIIHLKDKLQDGPEIGDTVLRQLLQYEEETRLGCEFIISRTGQSLYL